MVFTGHAAATFFGEYLVLLVYVQLRSNNRILSLLTAISLGLGRHEILITKPELFIKVVITCDYYPPILQLANDALP